MTYFARSITYKSIDINVSSYNIQVSDFIIQNRYTIIGEATVTLPALSTTPNGQVFIIIDSGNAAATPGHNLIIARTGADTINYVGGNYTIDTSRDARTVVANTVTGNWEISSWFRAI